jgi:ribosome-binding factor A
MVYRDRRAAEMIRTEVAKIIASELADPHLGFVTVVGVKLTKDLKRAIVFISVMGDEVQRRETVNHLERARGHVKNLLRHRITMRYMPEIHFEYDTLLAQEARISELIADLHRNESPATAPDDAA